MASTYFNNSKGVWETVVHMGKGIPRRRFTGKTKEEAEAKMAQAFSNPIVPPMQGRFETPSVEVKDNAVTVVMSPGQKINLGDLKGLLERRGLNPADWQIGPTKVNEWEGFAVIDKKIVKTTNTQLKVTLTPSIATLIPAPARIDGPKYTAAARTRVGESELVVVLPDQQIPFQDDTLHELVCDWLRTNKPNRMVLSGDFYDLYDISRHPKKAHELRMGGIQECLDVGYRIARDYVEAAGPTCTDRVIVPGNHEFRLQRFILENVPQFYNLRQAGDEALPPVLSLPYLSRLDELGFSWAADPVYEEDYPNGHAMLGSKLAVYHGWVARSKSGESALQTLAHLGHSVIVGHTHRQAIVAHTSHELNGNLRVLKAVEAGTLARVRGGLGYTVAPDWQPGFATVRLFPDGTFNIDLATYVNGTLLWGDQQFGRAKPTKRRLEAVA